MKNIYTTITILALLTLFTAGQSYAGSIWAKKSKNAKSMYSDDTARKIGDILTITINEATRIDSNVERDLEKEANRSVDWDGKVGIDHVLPSVPGFSVSLGDGSSQSLEGQAEYKDERTIEDNITVVVEDVQPNGNLVVLGSLVRDIAGDEQTIEVGGIVRPSDISFENNVLSSQVADFYMVVKNDGPSKTYNEVGWLGQILDFIWPF
ncbi:Basal body L-ring protein [Anaerohalosphaera lusitana]|uniref:Basal body L-ring protein n=1 Tax=Anaerohalosphaera lusitana TaxID=1936003 RepID=A0A1U9NG63_9BACT|nr:flagellar basal body L-ring protein FlgH [Anaerohalosphaera lusitana]AQT66919.1 Basal body L-ring protein [Anaerohalosphaera lusitana]